MKKLNIPNYAEDIYENFPQESDKNKNIDKTFSITYAGNIERLKI